MTNSLLPPHPLPTALPFFTILPTSWKAGKLLLSWGPRAGRAGTSWKKFPFNIILPKLESWAAAGKIFHIRKKLESWKKRSNIYIFIYFIFK
jgi:hypothetical protein